MEKFITEENKWLISLLPMVGVIPLLVITKFLPAIIVIFLVSLALVVVSIRRAPRVVAAIYVLLSALIGLVLVLSL